MASRVSAQAARAMQRTFALSLYKAILKSHRQKLPPVLRNFGDTYAHQSSHTPPATTIMTLRVLPSLPFLSFIR
jgi:hypothetical protein